MRQKQMLNQDYRRIESAIQYFTQHADQQPKLESVAAHLRLSTYHCHRLFRRWAGITPKDFLQMLTLAKAKQILPHLSLLDTSLSLGLSGPSRLHDLFVSYEAMSPGQYKKKGLGVRLYWDFFETALGRMLIAGSDHGIASLNFIEETPKAIPRLLTKKWPMAHFVHSKKELEKEEQEIRLRIQTGVARQQLSLLLTGSPFQNKVWQALLDIPQGQLTTYQRLARSIGKPQAQRAVGSAIAANPIAYLIPCHRVILSSGALGNYRWKPRRKLILISLENQKSRF